MGGRISRSSSGRRSEEEAKKTRGGFPPSRLFVEIESTLYIAMSLFLAMLDKYILEPTEMQSSI